MTTGPSAGPFNISSICSGSGAIWPMAAPPVASRATVKKVNVAAERGRIMTGSFRVERQAGERTAMGWNFM